MLRLALMLYAASVAIYMVRACWGLDGCCACMLRHLRPPQPLLISMGSFPLKEQPASERQGPRPHSAACVRFDLERPLPPACRW